MSAASRIAEARASLKARVFAIRTSAKFLERGHVSPRLVGEALREIADNIEGDLGRLTDAFAASSGDVALDGSPIRTAHALDAAAAEVDPAEDGAIAEEIRRGAFAEETQG
jgi:hypothetical protein